MKKVLSLVLVLAMVLVCVGAYAGPSPKSGAMNDHSFDYRGGNQGNYDANEGDGWHNETYSFTFDLKDMFKTDSHNRTFGGSNTYGSYNRTFGGSNTNGSYNRNWTFGGSNTNGSYNRTFGGSNTNGSYNRTYGGSNTYGSYNTRTGVTVSLDVSDVMNDKSMTYKESLKDVGNDKSRNSSVTISGSGNSDSSDHSNTTNYFYFGSFNDNSDYSTNDSYNKTTKNKDSGNSSSSSSSSAAGGSGSSGSKGGSSGSSGSGSGSSGSKGGTSGGSSSGSKGASSSASSKAIVINSSNGGSSGGGSGSGSSTVAPTIQLVQVPDTAETTALKNAFAEAIKAGDPKTALPENIASKLSADLKTVNEFVTAKLVGNISGLASATVNVAFPTKYSAGDKVVVLFGIPNGANTTWINVNGIIESDGSISMILTSTVLEALAGKTFALAVLSK